MKREILVILVFLALLLPVPGVFAQESGGDISDQLEGVQDLGDDLTDLKDTLSDDEERGTYLKQRWLELLDRSSLGPYLEGADSFLSSLDPFFSVVLGTVYQFSWVFLLTVVFWFLFLDAGYSLSSFFEPFILLYGRSLRLLVFVLFVVVYTVVRLPFSLAQLFVGFIAGTSSFVTQIIIIVILLAAIFFWLKYFLSIRAALAHIRERRAQFISQQRADRAEKTAVAVQKKTTQDRKVDRADRKEVSGMAELAKEFFEEMRKVHGEDAFDDKGLDPGLSEKDVRLFEKKAKWWEFWKTKG